MTSPKKRDSNKRNAQLSNGPIDTSTTRFNALKHGILSKESFIGVGDGREDAEVFKDFGDELRDSLNPVGAIEELLVDKLIGLTWRSRRVLRFETAAIRSRSDTAIDDLEQERAKDPLSGWRWQHTKDLPAHAKRLKEELKALDQEDPIAASPGIWRAVFWVASTQFAVPIEDILGLEESWEDFYEYSERGVRSIIKYACDAAKISERDFWQLVKEDVRLKSEEMDRTQVRRQWEIDRIRLSVSLPIDENLRIIQRYEAHISREFYKSLHELQRLQAPRLGLRHSVPLVIDIEVDPGSQQTVE